MSTINCPYCSKETKFVKEYNDHVCKNKDCSFYLKGDVKSIKIKKTLSSQDENNIQQMIDYIMENFDFEKVHKVMKFLDWGWGMPKTVPSIDEIKASAKDSMRRTAESGILNNSDYYTGTGGFFVSYFHEESDSPAEIKLDFNLESWDSGF